MNRSVLALIPAYNEAARVGDVVTRARPHVGEVVVVDDGSADDTAAVARRAGATVLRHPENRGKGAAILTALAHLAASGAQYGVLLDADGQHDPAEIPRLVAAAEEAGAGLVLGNRLGDTRTMPADRLWANRFTSWVTSRLAGQRIEDSQCGYRLLRRSVVADLKLTTSRFETETEMLIQAGRAGHRLISVPVRTIYLEGRQSHIHPFRDTVRFLHLALRYVGRGRRGA